MKLYTEEQIKKAMDDGMIPSIFKDDLLGQLISNIELPSDDEICDEAESIAHNYFVMQRNHYQGLEEGAKRMAYWLMKKIKQQ